MFDMSWSEMLLIAVVALIFIPPKDLPKLVKTVAGYARKARSMAREFQSGLEEMAREAELDELKRTVEDTAGGDLAKDIENSIDPSGSTTRMFDHPPDHVEPAPPAAEPGVPAADVAPSGQPAAIPPAVGASLNAGLIAADTAPTEPAAFEPAQLGSAPGKPVLAEPAPHAEGGPLPAHAETVPADEVKAKTGTAER